MSIDQIPFAVDLSQDGIYLWHRNPPQKWEFLGEVSLTSGNLRNQIESVITKKLGEFSSNTDTIVRIPNAEVNVFSLSFSDDTTPWEMQISKALEQASNLPFDQLSFDVDQNKNDDSIYIAWTPNQVIDQASKFVRLLGFNPQIYTTDLDKKSFPRTPYFALSEKETEPGLPIETNERENIDNTTPEVDVASFETVTHDAINAQLLELNEQSTYNPDYDQTASPEKLEAEPVEQVNRSSGSDTRKVFILGFILLILILTFMFSVPLKEAIGLG